MFFKDSVAYRKYLTKGTKNKKDLIRPCRHLDSNGSRCINRREYLQPVRDKIKKTIIHYKKGILNKLQGVNNRDVALIRSQLQSKRKELRKFQDATEGKYYKLFPGKYIHDTRHNRWK